MYEKESMKQLLSWCYFRVTRNFLQVSSKIKVQFPPNSILKRQKSVLLFREFIFMTAALIGECCCNVLQETDASMKIIIIMHHTVNAAKRNENRVGTVCKYYISKVTVDKVLHCFSDKLLWVIFPPSKCSLSYVNSNYRDNKLHK